MRNPLAALPVALALLLAGAAPARPQSEPAIPPPSGFVNDAAGVMDEPARARLEAFLDQLARKTGAQFGVLTVKTTEPLDPAEYKERVFRSWKLGQPGKDNGLLLLVAIDQRKIAFETGYGLEGVLPDALESRIIRVEMTPRFRAGDVAGGITAGVLRGGPDGIRGLPPLGIALAIVFFVVLLRLIQGGRGGWGAGPGTWSGRRGGWYVGSGWGGGFGGGSFGGGGGSFGGFGGGASGGGGGSGGW